MAAAVSDWRPATLAPLKVKKGAAAPVLELVRTPDILKRLGAAKGSLFLIGFAAETEGVREYARKKLVEKNLDLIVANDVSKPRQGFAAETNAAILIDRKGELEVPVVDKRELAERIWDRVVELRGAHASMNAAASQRAPRAQATETRRERRKGR